jgi:hypothetical protein
MRRKDLEMTLRAAASVADEVEFFLIGSQAVHAYCRKPPPEVLLSQECDLYPKNRPETANLLDSKLGRRSEFAEEHGFYADVVTPDLATLPTGWESRLKPFRADRITAFCLEMHDLLVSKLAAGRLKDLEFIGAMFHLHLADPKIVRERIQHVPMPNEWPSLRARLKAVVDDLFVVSAAKKRSRRR